jgi:hypothetical protein
MFEIDTLLNSINRMSVIVRNSLQEYCNYNFLFVQTIANMVPIMIIIITIACLLCGAQVFSLNILSNLNPNEKRSKLDCTLHISFPISISIETCFY